MNHNSQVKTRRTDGHVGPSFGLQPIALLLALLCLAVASSATAFGPPNNAPALGQPPVPNAGWQAQEIGGIQPWWQMGKVAPPPSTAVPWVSPYPAPPSMYDTSPGY